ncbi:hypothetical protein HGI47_20745 [Novosphingobium sp. ERN07]|uniref:hypothetical protein n=1 Tax=Novosphingobium sp. ERN07 TaxID=2726187 RepID=UPI001456B994|nr:hypothetical protein [Novosphingobium sp. ERN07]NLR73303.1 hypothetical protein [Novosphingobium sp. ERN07]
MKSEALKVSLLIGGSLMAIMMPVAAFAADAAQAQPEAAAEVTGNEIIVTATNGRRARRRARALRWAGGRLTASPVI